MNETVVFLMWFVVGNDVQPLLSGLFTQLNVLLILIPVIAVNIPSTFSDNWEWMDGIDVIAMI